MIGNRQIEAIIKIITDMVNGTPKFKIDNHKAVLEEQKNRQTHEAYNEDCRRGLTVLRSVIYLIMIMYFIYLLIVLAYLCNNPLLLCI